MVNAQHIPHAPQAIAIVGATASGKTSVAEYLAALLPIEIISADSRQMYKYLTIGTAKPEPALLEAVPHHFIDTLTPDQHYSAGQFGSEATALVHAIRQRGCIPVIVGGSGLYVQALCEGFFREENSADTTEYRTALEQRWKSEGIDVLYNELQRVDLASATLYNDRNPRRVLRALEYFYATGCALSEAQQRQHEQRDFATMYFAIEIEREQLYKRINTRTEEMFANGIVEETEAVLQMGFSPELNALNTVGYKECMALLRGELSRERAISLTQQNTRRYAKRQLTWFRRNAALQWCNNSPEALAKLIANKYISVGGSSAL